MLNHQHANCGAGGLERNTQPGRRSGAHQFNFAFRCETVEFRLRNQGGFSGAKNISHAGTGNFLRRRRRIELVDKERKMKHVILLVMQSNEEIFRVHHFVERSVDLVEQFVEVGSFVQRMDHIGKHHALSFQALKFCDVLIADQDSAHIRIAQPVDRNDVKPPPLPGFGA